MFDIEPLFNKVYTSKEGKKLKEWIKKYSNPNESAIVSVRSNYYGDLIEFYINEATDFIENKCYDSCYYDLTIQRDRILINGTPQGYKYSPLTPVVFLGCIFISIKIADYGYKGFDKAKTDILRMMKNISADIYYDFMENVLEQKEMPSQHEKRPIIYSGKRPGRKVCSLKDCLLVKDDKFIEEMRMMLNSLPDGPTKAEYINKLKKNGELLKFPSFMALKNEKMIDLSESAWNNAMSQYR